MSVATDVSRLIMALPQMEKADLSRLADAAMRELTHRPLPKGSPDLWELMNRADATSFADRIRRDCPNLTGSAPLSAIERLRRVASEGAAYRAETIRRKGHLRLVVSND